MLIGKESASEPYAETLEPRTLLSVNPVLVADLVVGAGGSNPSDFVNVNGTLYFRANDGVNGDELWRSDGTSAGTTLVKDINGSGSSFPYSLTNVNGMLFFSVDDGVNGEELWRSDGTSAGTTLVKNINGSGSSSPRALTNVNGTLFFRAHDGVHGNELWRSDGTEAGTTLVKDIGNGSVGSDPSYLTNVNGTLFLRAYDNSSGFELWQSDGTSAGTTLVKDINESDSSHPLNLTNVNGTLFFSANDGTNGFEVWRSDGTEAGTTLVVNVNRRGSSSPSSLANVNGKLFFGADDGLIGHELWQSDSTEAGTALVKDIAAGQSSPDLGFLTNVNGTLFFSAVGTEGGYELWQSDGTEAGTTLVKDINVSDSSYPRSLTNVNGTLFFRADDGTNGNELWKADVPDDTPRVTPHDFSFSPPELVKDLHGGGGSFPDSFANVNGRLFFGANDGTNGSELWRSDGTSAGTTLVKDINGSGSSYPRYLTNVNGILFFSVDDGVNGYELWRSDGTSAGTTLVKDINVSGSSNPRYLANVNGTLFFRANDGTNGNELWRSDGTSAGTTLVKDINAGGGAYPRSLTNINGTLFFSATDGVNGAELWKSDGTSAGTTLVKDINENGNSYPTSLMNRNGTLFFSANDGVNGYELWKSNGTSAGTTLVKDIRSGGNSGYPSLLTDVNGTLFFSATDDANGQELWKSDGTSAGTTLVKDIKLSGNSYPRYLANVNGTLFFRADDGSNGYELWESNGTSAGTTLVKDIRAGSNSSYPHALTNVNGTLFFRANDGTSGFELWSMAVDTTPLNSRPQLTAFAAAVETTPEDTEIELSFTELMTQGDESDTDGTVTAFIVQAVTSGTLKIGTSAASATSFAVGSNDRIDATKNAYWTPEANLSGNAMPAFSVLAQDNIGENSLLPVTATVNVTAVADTPSVTNAVTPANTQTTSGLVIARNAADGAEVTHFKITNITGGMLFQNNATTPIQSGAYITAAQASAGLRFTPAQNSLVTGHFSVQASTSNSDSGLGGSIVVANITVTPALIGTAGSDAFVLTYSATSLVSVTISTNGGAATAFGTFPVNVPLTINGLGGTDSVRVVGTSGADTILVNSSTGLTVNGASLTLASIETRTLAGGAGGDVYRFDADTVLGVWALDESGGGIDTVDFSPTTTVGLVLNLATAGTQAVHASNLSLILGSGVTIENATGGSGADNLIGNGLSNTLQGGPGNDTLIGALGNDFLFGGANNDTYHFGPASVAEADQVTENPNEGTDILNFATVTTGIRVNLAENAVQTVHVNRTLKLNSPITFENVTGGAGADNLIGNSLNNTLLGGAGNDALNGALGSDFLLGGANDDAYLFGPSSVAEADQVTENLNEGTDTLNFGTLTTGIRVNLAENAVQAVHANRTLKLNSPVTFENFIGGSGADTLIGNSLANVLTGGPGDDTLNGSGGSDVLIGGANNDTYLFGVATAAEADQVTENTNEGTDTLNFGFLSTDVVLNLGSLAVQPVHLNRTLRLNSVSTFENAMSGNGNDTLLGNALANRLTGGNGNNILVGLEAADILVAGNGRDILIGGLGLDVLNGGTGDDILIAGRTTSDSSLSSLNTLRTAWVSAVPYGTRVTNLRAGVGSPVVSLKAKVNVLNDGGEADVLTGGGDTDWYFRALNDVITDLVAGELIDVL